MKNQNRVHKMMTFGAPCGAFTSNLGGGRGIARDELSGPRIVRLRDRKHSSIESGSNPGRLGFPFLPRPAAPDHG